MLGVTQIIGWGAMFFPSVLTVPLAAAERGWPPAFAMAGFSTGLLVAGLASPRVGASVDRFGGHVVMPAGLLVGALGLVLLVFAASRFAWIAAWAVIGVGMAGSFYDAAFATLGRIFGMEARKPITWLTLVSGFASTLSWPGTHALIGAVGWRGTYLVYAALLALVAAPLAACALPRSRAAPEPRGPAGRPGAATLAPRGLVFVLVASAFASYAFVHSGMAAHSIAIFGRMGLDTGTAVALGALVGPAQFAARLVELGYGRRLHPLWIARFAVALLLVAFGMLATVGVSTVSVAAFMLMYGLANGAFTIARGAVPLVLFGAAGYGSVMGRMALPFLVMQAIAPIALAFLAERMSDTAALVTIALFAGLSLACFALIRRAA